MGADPGHFVLTEIPDKFTTATLAEGIRCLADGCELFLGAPLEPKPLAILGAQVCLETGRFQKMHCWNPGNRKLPKDWDGTFCRYACDEIFDAQTARAAQRLGACYLFPRHDGLVRVALPAEHPWSRFVGFLTAPEGFSDYVGLIAKRYPTAWSKAYAGDTAGFVAALKAGHYFTADEIPYCKGVVSLVKTLLPLCEALDNDALSAEEHERVESLIAVTLSDSLHDGYPYGERLS